MRPYTLAAGNLCPVRSQRALCHCEVTVLASLSPPEGYHPEKWETEFPARSHSKPQDLEENGATGRSPGPAEMAKKLSVKEAGVMEPSNSSMYIF